MPVRQPQLNLWEEKGIRRRDLLSKAVTKRLIGATTVLTLTFGALTGCGKYNTYVTLQSTNSLFLGF